MTLEGKDLEWFRTLTPSNYPSLKALEKDFIATFSKIGRKHYGLTFLYEFKQESSESLRDYALQFKKHLARCPKSKTPCQERLVSLFIEGLVNRELHAMLYIKHHKTMNECIREAIEFDDNCKRTMSHDQARTSTPSDVIYATYVEEVIKAIADRMQNSQEPQRVWEQQAANRPYTCGICGGNHLTSQCAPKSLEPLQVRPVIQAPQWCDFHQSWGNHNTKNFVEQVKRA